MIGEIGKLAGVPIVENKFLPKDTIIIVGGKCRDCGENIHSSRICTVNFPMGHFPQYKIIKLEEPPQK